MADEPTVGELAALSEDDRIQYFLDHPLPTDDPSIDPLLIARHRAGVVLTIKRRDEEQAARRARAS